MLAVGQGTARALRRHGIEALRRAEDLMAAGTAPGEAIVDGYRLAFLVGAGLLVAATVASATLMRGGTVDMEHQPVA